MQSHHVPGRKPVCSSATCQHLSLAKTWLLNGLEGKERTLMSKSSCGLGQRWAICSNPTLQSGKGRRDRTMGFFTLLPSNVLRSC